MFAEHVRDVGSVHVWFVRFRPFRRTDTGVAKRGRSERFGYNTRIRVNVRNVNYRRRLSILRFVLFPRLGVFSGHENARTMRFRSARDAADKAVDFIVFPQTRRLSRYPAVKRK